MALLDSAAMFCYKIELVRAQTQVIDQNTGEKGDLKPIWLSFRDERPHEFDFVAKQGHRI